MEEKKEPRKRQMATKAKTIGEPLRKSSRLESSKLTTDKSIQILILRVS